MNIKRFVAPDMREALRAIRSSLGADAVMLSSRRLETGVEVIAAIDYDDSLAAAVGGTGAGGSAGEARPDAGAGALRGAVADADARSPAAVRGQPAAGAGRSPGRGAVQEHEGPEARDPISEYQRIAESIELAAVAHEDRAAAPAAPGTGEAASPPDAAVRRSGRVRRVPAAVLTDELKDLRRLLETQLASLAWNDLNRRSPARARVLRQFADLGIDALLAEECAADMEIAKNPRESWRLPLRRFAQRLPLLKGDPVELGGVYAFVGPTGVGKTTTIAKIAARFILRHGPGRIGLVTTDTYRIGAREQLMTFARILGAPVHMAAGGAELGPVLDALAEKQLVLVDTAGMSQRDLRLAAQFSTLRAERRRVRTVLVLSAAAARGTLLETLRVFRGAGPKALVVTKVDEATSLGPVLSLAVTSRLPIAYLTDGQRVPEDLHLAARKRLWLMQTAMRLARLDPGRPSEDELAAQFGTLEAAGRA